MQKRKNTKFSAFFCTFHMLPHPNEAYLQFGGYFMIHRLPHTEGRPRFARTPPLIQNKKAAQISRAA